MIAGAAFRQVARQPSRVLADIQHQRWRCIPQLRLSGHSSAAGPHAGKPVTGVPGLQRQPGRAHHDVCGAAGPRDKRDEKRAGPLEAPHREERGAAGEFSDTVMDKTEELLVSLSAPTVAP